MKENVNFTVTSIDLTFNMKHHPRLARVRETG